jgi:beta-lactamase class D
MKKVMLCLSVGLLFSTLSLAQTKCFLAKEGNNVIKQEGSTCKIRYAPESTFKIPLGLMGYDAGILQDETTPVWPFKEGYNFFINVCKGPHNPKTWMRDSCVWYSQVITQKLGVAKFKEYIQKFNYGNQDVSGDPGKNNGLTNAWLSSSLQISADEQTSFLKKLSDNKLPVNARSHAQTKKILFIQDLAGGWKLYGKTGSGRLRDENGIKSELQHGWFIGWIEKQGRVVTFASHIADDKKEDTFASFRAKNEALNKLWYLIDGFEK